MSSVIIVTESNLDRHLIEVTLKNAGFLPRCLYTVAEVEYALQHDGQKQVLVIDEELLDAEEDNPWRRLMDRWPRMGLVRLQGLPGNREGYEPAPGKRLSYFADATMAGAVREAVGQAFSNAQAMDRGR